MKMFSRKSEKRSTEASLLGPLASLLPIKAIVTVLGATLLLVAGYFFSLYAIHGFDRDFLAINKCVEMGGRWNHQLRICEKLQDIYEPPNPLPQF